MTKGQRFPASVGQVHPRFLSIIPTPSDTEIRYALTQSHSGPPPNNKNCREIDQIGSRSAKRHPSNSRAPIALHTKKNELTWDSLNTDGLPQQPRQFSPVHSAVPKFRRCFQFSEISLAELQPPTMTGHMRLWYNVPSS